MLSLATATQFLNPIKVYLYGAAALAVVAGGVGIYVRIKYLEGQVQARDTAIQNLNQEIGRTNLALEQAKGAIRIVKEKGEVQVIHVKDTQDQAEKIEKQTSAEVLETLTKAEVYFTREATLKELQAIKWESK